MDNKWLIEIGNNDDLWEKITAPPFPVYIRDQYDSLRQFAKNGNLYGVMLQIKDVYETSIKIPCIIALSMIDESIIFDGKERVKDVFEFILKKPLSMGDWEVLAKKMIDSSAVSEQMLIDLLQQTRDLFNKKIGNTKIVKWRNETIGHGMLRAEDDEENNNAIRELLSNLKEYFENAKVSEAYERVYFSINGERPLETKTIQTNELSELELNIGEKRIGTSKYACIENAQCFFFESYYKFNKKVKYISYDTGRELKNYGDIQGYFKSLVNEYFKAGLLRDESTKGRIQNHLRDEAMKCLADDDQYVKPQYLIDKLEKTFSQEKSGIIMIEMERGMGKTAFALHSSSDYPKGSLFDRTASRSYNLADVRLREISNFINKTNEYLRNAPKSISEDYIDDSDTFIHPDGDDNSADMSRLMNGFKDLFLNSDYSSDNEIENAVYFLDGVDELTNDDANRILSYLPEKGSLEEGAFIVLLSRFPDEKDLSSRSRSTIQKFEERADKIIHVKRDDTEYRKSLLVFVKKILPKLKEEEYRSVLEMTEYRFLGCKLFKLCNNKQFTLNNHGIQDLAGVYLKSITSTRNIYARNELMDFLSAITLLGSISLDQYSNRIQFSDITFRLIGCVNDALPLLLVERGRDTNYYRWANEEYRSLFMVEYEAEVLCFAETLKNAVETWYSRCRDELAEWDPDGENIKRPDKFNEDSKRLEYFEDVDGWLFYMSVLHALYKLAKTNEKYEKIFYSEDFYVIYCKASYELMVCAFERFGGPEISTAGDQMRDDFSEVLLYALNYDDSLVLNHVDDIKRIIEYVDYSKNEDIMECMLRKFTQTGNTEWLKLLFNEYSGLEVKHDEIRSYLTEIKKSSKESILVDYLVHTVIRMLRTKDYFFKMLWEPRIGLYKIIEELINFDFEKSDKEKLLSIRVYLELMGELGKPNAYLYRPLEEARLHYDEILDRGFEFVYVEENICPELSKENVVRLLSATYRDDQIDAISKLASSDVLTEGQFNDSYQLLRTAYFENCNSNINSEIVHSLKLLYDKLMTMIKDQDESLPCIEDSSMISDLVDILFDEKQRASIKSNWIDILLQRKDWYTERIIVDNIEELMACVIWDEEFNPEIREEYLKKYIFEVDMVYYFYNRVKDSFPESMLSSIKPVCSPDGLWFLSNYKKKYLESSDDDIERLAAQMSKAFDEIYARYKNLSNRNSMLQDRALLSANCRKLLGKDIDDTWLKEIDLITENEIISPLSNYDDRMDFGGIEMLIEEVSSIYYMTAEYTRACAFYDRLLNCLPEKENVSEISIGVIEDIRCETKLLRVLFGYFNNGSDEEAVKALDFERFGFCIPGLRIIGEPTDYRILPPILELGEEVKNSIISGQKRVFDFTERVDLIHPELECKAKNIKSSYELHYEGFVKGL